MNNACESKHTLTVSTCEMDLECDMPSGHGANHRQMLAEHTNGARVIIMWPVGMKESKA